MIQFLRRKPRVLMLDDDRAMQRLVTTLLQRQGFRVEVFDNGLAAIEAIRRGPYDALILDLMMPIEGGMTVIRHLRTHDPKAMTRVVVLSAAPESLLRNLADDVGTIVRKPFEHAELIATVKKLVAG